MAEVPNPVATDPQKEGWIKRKAIQVGNNTRLIDLYARLKDYYKLAELTGPALSSLFVFLRRKDKDSEEPEIESIQADIDRAYTSNDLDKVIGKKAELKSAVAKFETAKFKDDLSGNVIADSGNFLVQFGISTFSSWWEKKAILQTYEELIRADNNFPANRPIKFSDLKKSDNPIIQEAARYYSRKSLFRYLPDFSGLIRLIPAAFYIFKPDLMNQRKTSGLGKALNVIAEKADGIKLSLGLKTLFFSWYFLERQTGSNYVLKQIWNKTEGQKPENRRFNNNALSNDFVSGQEVALLYQKFREEQIDRKEEPLEPFTPDDPLSSRIFEQVSRYLNHAYTPKVFEINERGKQEDMKGTYFSHALLVEFMGNGGLDVQDALASALKLEVLATHGDQPAEALQRFRHLSNELSRIARPDRDKYTTQEQKAEALKPYLEQVNQVAMRYLKPGRWPANYINTEIEDGFIEYFLGTKGEAINQELKAELKAVINAGSTVAVAGHSPQVEPIERREPNRPELSQDRLPVSKRFAEGREPLQSFTEMAGAAADRKDVAVQSL